MNPIAAAALGSVFRAGLMFLAGWLVQRGVWTGAEAETYVTAAAIALVTLAWSIWNKYKGRIRLLTALDAPPGTSEKHVDALIESGRGAEMRPKQ